LALLLRPQDADAQAGVQRAQTLPQVLALMQQAADLGAAGAPPAAQEHLRQALALDSEYQQAREQLQQVTARIADNAFTATMSQGFAALQDNDADAAIAAFEKALAMRPDSREAQAAIDQTRDQL